MGEMMGDQTANWTAKPLKKGKIITSSGTVELKSQFF
jgi:hypothetical protein